MSATPAASPTLILSPPDVLAPVASEATQNAVPLKPEYQDKVAAQVAHFVEALLGADPQSPEFQQKVDDAFRAGRKEITDASTLLTGRFLERNYVGIEDSPAFAAITELRQVFNDFNPAGQDLLAPRKVLGFIPFGNKLEQYFQKYQSAASHIQQLMNQLALAEDEMRKDAAEIEVTKARMWDALQKLEAGIAFVSQLDAEISARIDNIRASDSQRARALEQEVLFYVRQNHSDLLAQKTVTVNAYLTMEQLKKTAREMITGCDRVATLGISALATAQTVARATGNQVKVMELLQGTSQTIEKLIVGSSEMLGQHVQKTAEFASNPLIGVQTLQTSLENTLKAIDSFDGFRAAALSNMAKNNTLLQGLIDKTQPYVDRARGEVKAATHTGSVLGI